MDDVCLLTMTLDVYIDCHVWTTVIGPLEKLERAMGRGSLPLHLQ